MCARCPGDTSARGRTRAGWVTSVVRCTSTSVAYWEFGVGREGWEGEKVGPASREKGHRARWWVHSRSRTRARGPDGLSLSPRPTTCNTVTSGDLPTLFAAVVLGIKWKYFYRRQTRGRRVEIVSVEWSACKMSTCFITVIPNFKRQCPRESDCAGEVAKVNARVLGFSKGLLPPHSTSLCKMVAFIKRWNS